MTEQIVKIEEVTAIVAKAPDMLAQNRESHSKAIAYGKKLLEHHGQFGMSPELYKNILEYFDRVKKTPPEMLKRRSPFTQIVDMMRKEFTHLENDLSINDGTKNYPNQVLYDLKNLCDKYAAEQVRKQREEEARVAAELAKKTEAIQIAKDCEIYYIEQFNLYFLQKKTAVNAILNNSTLENIDEISDEIKGISNSYFAEAFEQIKFNKSYPLHSLDEMQDIILNNVDFDKLFTEFCEQYKKGIDLIKLEVIDKIPTKRNQLIEEKKRRDAIEAEENKKKKAKLQAEAEAKAKAESDRQAAEAERLKKESEIAAAKQAEKKEIQAAGQTAKVITSTQATLFKPEIEVKKNYKIKIKDVAGYMEIIAFWWAGQGKNLTSAKIEKMTIERMVTFAEKQMPDTEIKSEFIEYTEIITSK